MTWLRGRRRRPNIFQVLWRAGTINSAAAAAALRDQTDLLLQPTLEHVDLLNWRAFNDAIEAGFEHAASRLDTLSPELRPQLRLERR
jgi:NTE family protein